MTRQILCAKPARVALAIGATWVVFTIIVVQCMVATGLVGVVATTGMDLGWIAATICVPLLAVAAALLGALLTCITIVIALRLYPRSAGRLSTETE